MKTKINLMTLVVLLCMIPFSMSAEKYFFTPGGAGEKDGSSWANAAEGEILGISLASFESGDEVYLTGGAYYPDMDMYHWKIPQGITIKGGFPVGLTDASTEISYPTGNETIFSGDYDGDGIGDNGSAGFIQILNPNNADAGEDTKDNFDKITISGITITKSNYTGANYGGGALFIKHANVELNWVKIIGNVTSARGGAGFTAWGSYVTCKDCIFKDNYVPDNAGSAWLARQYKSGTAADQTNRSVIIFDRCEFTNNTTSAGDASAYGGGASMADHAGTLYMANCTWSGSKALRAGGALRISTGVNFYCISSTFFDNYTNYGDKDASGDAISAGTNANTYFANTVFVNEIDTYDTNKSLLFFQAGTTKAYSSGYNVWGTIKDAGDNSGNFKATDKISTSSNVYTKSVVFGTNTLGDNGGWSQTIAPSMDVSGMKVSDLEALITQWDLPKDIDLTLDQRGYKRAAVTMSGAMDPNATPGGNSLETVISDKATVISLGNGIYSLPGISGRADIYDISGKMLVKNIEIIEGSTIDLSAMTKGLYLISINGQVFKVIR